MSIHLPVGPFKILDKVLELHRWIPHKKIVDPYFFSVWIVSLCGVMPLLKSHNEILQFKLGQLIEDNE